MKEVSSEDKFENVESNRDTDARLTELLDDRLDVEALAQLVEHRDYSRKLSARLTSAFQAANARSKHNSDSVDAVQEEMRNLIMDVALLKRALASIGHIGVMERRKIEKELIRELFPATQPRRGVGLTITRSNKQAPQQVDCENRIHLCKAACCRIFKVGLTAEEIERDQFDWDPRNPYSLRKNQKGCVNLKNGQCGCNIYDNRPKVCQTYSCAKDSRIWSDFEGKIINPELKKRLDGLQVSSRLQPSLDCPETVEPSNGAGPLERKADKPQGGNPVESNDNHTISEMPTEVSPPNFDDLRELMIPKPKKKFNPGIEN